MKRGRPALPQGVCALAILCMLTLAFLPAACPETAWAKEAANCIQRLETGTINWSTGQVTASGSAAPEKQQDGTLTPLPGSARAQATARLIQTLKQIAITPELSVGQYAATHDKILAGIEKTAQDAETIRQIYTSALDVDIRVEASIFGGFLQLVLPEHIRQIPKIAEQKPKQDGASAPVAPVNQIPYTGLIIDARELQLTPILYPVIVSEEGKEVYSSLFISREFAVQYGVCTYICDMDRALAFRRIGSNPLVFKALRKEGNTSGNIVISMTDAKTIEKVTERHRFFKECRVIIVTGPKGHCQ